METVPGQGNRDRQLQMMAARLKEPCRVETVAICDLWKNNRERAASSAARDYNSLFSRATASSADWRLTS